MLYADMHCDTFYRLRAGEGTGLRENGLDNDLLRMKRAGCMAQCFAMFLVLEQHPDPWAEVTAMIDLYEAELGRNADIIRPAKSAADIRENRARGLMSAVLTVEEGGVCRGSLERLDELYSRGVRMLTLTWNFKNELGCPAAGPERGGLTETGLKFVERMQSLGMAVDVSHLSDEGFWDVCRVSRRPFAASHSNCRALCAHHRNLTDDMLRAIAERGGVAGANFCPPFVAGGDGGGRVSALAGHIMHMINVGGLGCAALGSDLDGFGGETQLRSCAAFPRLADELVRRGLSEDEAEAVFSGNFLRFLGDAVG